jgi:hypothetical protein
MRQSKVWVRACDSNKGHCSAREASKGGGVCRLLALLECMYVALLECMLLEAIKTCVCNPH